MSTSRMSQMTALGADWWNDSGVASELGAAVARGAVGGTSNPVIVAQAAQAHPELCRPVLERLRVEQPHATEDELAWQLIHTLGIASAQQLLPVYTATRGAKGFLSMQVNPKYYPHRDRMVAQAVELAALAPNIAIKAPATAVGIAAMEEMTARGIRVNATVSFSVAQALAASAAMERGLRRARAAGLDAESICPYITLMIGRVDDHLKRVAASRQIVTSPGLLDWAGIAVFKHAHRIFQGSGRPGTLLAAAYRHEKHWSQLIGRDVLQTIPYTWWTQFDTTGAEPRATLEDPVDDAILAELRAKFPDFVQAYDADGLPPDAFLRYGPTVHTLRQFLGGYDELVAFVRAAMLD